MARADKSTIAGLAPKVELEGDFDVAVTLDVLKIEKPTMRQFSSVFLHIGFDEDSKPAASLMFVYRHDGRKEVHLRMQRLDSDGKNVYRRVRTINVESVSGMRIARRGKRLSFLFKDNDSDPYRVLAQIDSSVKPVRIGFIRLLVRPGGAGRETEVLWKQLDIHADKIERTE